MSSKLIKRLRSLKPAGSYFYMATPYSKYEQGIHVAFLHACQAAAWLVRHGVPAYSPIAHTHPIALHGEMDPLDHDIWLPADRPMMDAAGGLLIVRMPGWSRSYGIQVEADVFAAAGKPVEYLPWPLP
jgi:hypothetical protein